VWTYPDFLHFVCYGENSDKHAYRFLYGKICERLKNNDAANYNNTECQSYFKDVYRLQEELECVILIYY